MTKNKLIEEAKIVREKAYVPYSHFPVGAALLTKEGEIYTGCNVENAAYPSSCCAERITIFNAISDGHINFMEMAVVADTVRPVSPCGSCRQVMVEFFSPDMKLHLANLKEESFTLTMESLLPHAFQSKDLNYK